MNAIENKLKQGIQNAVKKAYETVNEVKFGNAYYRKDIGLI